MPFFDLLPHPKSRAAPTEINGGARHVGVSLQVSAHAIGMSEAEDPCHVVRIDEVLGVHHR